MSGSRHYHEAVNGLTRNLWVPRGSTRAVCGPTCHLWVRVRGNLAGMSPDVTSLTSRAACHEADEADPLRSFRDRFDLPEGVIYLDGNSLGAAPRAARTRALQVLERDWATDLIGSWNKNHWFELPTRIGDKIGKLIGASPGTCVATDTTSINVFKALAAALQIQELDHPGRRVIVSERENFPTDLYLAEGLIGLLDRGYELRLFDSPSELTDALNDEVALALLTQVNYRTAELWDMAQTTRQIHDAGALVVWDLCHSVGALPIDLERADADFAVGCTYKYLNGGPGSPAFVWVASAHQNRVTQPLSGWWSHAQPFEMAADYVPEHGIRRFLSGTQPILSLATMESGIDLALEADMTLVREKSLALTSLFMRLVEQRLAQHPLTLVTPTEASRRGSHVSFRHADGYAVMQALIAHGVIGDYREPEVLRFGITPLYVGYVDVWDAVETLRQILDDELWRAPHFQARGAVT